MRELDEERAAERQEKDQQRRARIPTLDKARRDARLRLLECDAQVGHAEAERAGLASHERYPAMPDTHRAGEIAALDQRIDSLRATRDDLRHQVGDPETVVDQHGYLPSERREITLLHFRIWREQEVRELRRQVDDINTKFAEKGRDRAERSALKNELNKDRYLLRELVELPRRSAEDMCSECVTPMIWHGYEVRGWLFESGPCPAWPDWAQRIRQARGIIRTAMESRPTRRRPRRLNRSRSQLFPLACPSPMG